MPYTVTNISVMCTGAKSNGVNLHWHESSITAVKMYSKCYCNIL